MIRHHELGLRYQAPKLWKSRFSQLVDSPPTWQEMWTDHKTFLKLRGKLKEDLNKMIGIALENSDTEEQIAKNLDPLFERLSKSYFCSNSVDEDLLLKKANKNTLQKKINEWCAQLVFNIPIVKSRPGIKNFFGKFKDVPCVIVAAGPSLANNIDQLREIKDKAIIISMDTSFRSLMKRGIEPDFVNAHDANINGQKFFKNLPTKTVGVFVNYIHPVTVASYQGPLAFYYVDDESIPVYKCMAHACDGHERPDGTFLDSKILGGSSVAHTALYLAIELGCNPITFLGLDLSYPDLNRSHFETDNPKDIKSQKLIDVVNIKGEKVKTNLSFYSYKVVFERMAPILSVMKNKKFFTSTEDEKGESTGVVMAGLEPLPFKQWRDLYIQNDRSEIKNIEAIYKEALNGKKI